LEDLILAGYQLLAMMAHLSKASKVSETRKLVVRRDAKTRCGADITPLMN
jgi:hypothetical protein